MRSMYLHSFQSVVFNHAASERVRLFGCHKAVAGDLVAKHVADTVNTVGVDTPSVELIADAEHQDRATANAMNRLNPDEESMDDYVADAGSGNADLDVHVVTEEEVSAAMLHYAPYCNGMTPCKFSKTYVHHIRSLQAALGVYSVHDVLLPMPGFKVCFSPATLVEDCWQQIAHAQRAASSLSMLAT